MLPYGLDLVQQTKGRLVANILLLQAWSPERATYWSYNAPSWSVSCELFFYAVFPACFAFLSPRPLARVGGVSVALFAGVVVAAAAFPGLDQNWLSVVCPVSGLTAFVIGVGAGVLCKRWRQVRISVLAATVVQIMALFLVVGANAWCNTHVFTYLPPAAASYVAVFGPTPCYAALLLALALFDGLVSRVLAARVLVYGGEISYSIYLFHQTLIRWHSTHLQAFSAVPMWLQYVCLVAAVLLVAATAYHLVEKPGRRLIIGVWRRWNAQPGTGAVIET
jgi:peptidoglycan/LPS O-acetylase OafA/YrhL